MSKNHQYNEGLSDTDRGASQYKDDVLPVYGIPMLNIRPV